MNLSKFMCSKIGAFFIILPFIKPASEILGPYNIVFNFWKIIAIFLILISCFCNRKKVFNTPVNLLFFVQIIYFISTIINMGDIKTALGQMSSNISICMYLVYLYKKNEFIAIRNFAYPTTFMAILTAITMFLYYPNGMYHVVANTYTETSNYLWGFDNTSGLLFASTIFFLIIYSMYVNRSKTYIYTLFIIIFSFCAFLYVQSITAFLMIFFELVVYLFVIYFGAKFKALNPKKIITFVVVGFIIIIAFNQYFTRVWDYLMTIDKYYSVKARVIFFNNEFKYISKSPLWGYGIESKNILISKIKIDHPHNYFMDLLYRGGVLAILTIAIFFYKLIRNSKIKDLISVLTSCCLLSIFILVMLDFYNEKYLFYPQIALTYFLITDRKFLLKKEDIHSGIKMNVRYEKEKV